MRATCYIVRSTRSPRMPMHHPPYPGGIIRRQCLKPLGLSVTEAAAGLGITRQALSDLLNGKAGVSVDMAIRLFEGLWVERRHLARPANCLRFGASARARPPHKSPLFQGGLRSRQGDPALPRVSSGGGFMLWLWALKNIAATRVTVFLLALAAAALGAALLGEPVTMQM